MHILEAALFTNATAMHRKRDVAPTAHATPRFRSGLVLKPLAALVAIAAVVGLLDFASAGSAPHLMLVAGIGG